MRLEIVDVFAEAPLEGNQLAVVDLSDSPDRELTGEQMQSIAREMNFSETTFITQRTDERASVRIFTPSHELPFAGHPTLGTAWVLGRHRAPASYTLDLEVGPVEVSLGSGNNGICWMSPPQPKVLGTLGVERAAELLHLEASDLHPDYPATFIELGPQFVFVPVRDEAVLAAVSIDLDIRRALLDEELAAGSVFAFCPTPEPTQVDYAARLFFDAGGIREDPATGSANSAFAVYLRDLCGVPAGQYTVAQGDYIQRPSRIYLDIHSGHYRVGGRVQQVASGELADTLF